MNMHIDTGVCLCVCEKGGLCTIEINAINLIFMFPGGNVSVLLS